MFGRSFVRSLFVVACLAGVPTLRADQYVTQAPAGKAYVVHTRLAPVLMHRALPPFTGIHIHQRELEKGRRGPTKEAKNEPSSELSR